MSSHTELRPRLEDPPEDTTPLLLSPTSSYDQDEQPPRIKQSQDDNSSSFRLHFKVGASLLSYFVLGLFLPTLGSLSPHIQEWYQLSDAHLSILFFLAPAGYVIAAQFNRLIHFHLGQRGIAVIGPALHLAFTIGLSLRPPFPVLLVCVALGGAGFGLLDGSWNAWASNLHNANVISGLLHGVLSAGASVGPVLVHALLSGKDRSWNQWYYILTGFCFLELVLLAIAFRDETAERYRQEKLQPSLGHTEQTTDFSAINNSAVKLCAAYLLMYVGAETAITDWIVIFMTRARNATPAISSMCISGYWIGVTAGRILLSFVTQRIGVERASLIYLGSATATQILFALVELPVLSVVLMVLLGFFCGPIFPSSIIMMVSMLPEDAHVAASSFVASAGQVGGALLPFVLGLLVQAVGIRVFQYVIVAQLIATLTIWVVFIRSCRGQS